MLFIVLSVVCGVVVEQTPLHIIGIFPTHLSGARKYYVRESQFSNQGWRISESTVPEATWTDRFSFYAYSTQVTGTTAFYVHTSNNPERYMVSTNEFPPIDWFTYKHFYAFATMNNTRLKGYFCAQDKLPTIANDEKYVVAISNATASQPPWGVRPLEFYAYPPDIVSESLKYMSGVINSEKVILPEYKIIVDEEHDNCDSSTGRNMLLTRISNDPAKYYAVLGFRCAVTEQISLLAPMLRVPNIGLSAQAAVANYPNAWRLHVNEVDYTEAMFDIVKTICKWHRIGISFAGERYRPHAKNIEDLATKNGVSVGFMFDSMAPDSGTSAWGNATSTNTRIVAVLGPPGDVARILCDQVKVMRSGLVVLSTYQPKDAADRFWRDVADPECTPQRMDDAAKTMLFFNDPHQRPENVQLGCVAKTSSEYQIGWEAHRAANNIDADDIAYNAADSICVFAKLSQDFIQHSRRFTVHDETRNINSASSMCIERGGFLAIISGSIPADLKSAIEAGTRSSYLIDAKRVGNSQWKTLAYNMLSIPNALWEPFAGFGRDTHDYVGLYLFQGDLKLKELGDAVGIAGDASVGYVCEYGPMWDMVARKSEKSFSALNERMKFVDFEGLTGRLRFKSDLTFSHSIRSVVKVMQVKDINGQASISDVGRYDLALQQWFWSGGTKDTGLKWLPGTQNACLTGGDSFPQCAAGKRPVWFECTWIPCNETVGMSGTAPNCGCEENWYNKTVGVVQVESWSCEECTPDIDHFFCPENVAQEEVTPAPANDTDEIDPDDLVASAHEKRVMFLLMVPATVDSVTLNAAFAESVQRAAESVYGFDTQVEVNYITTGGGRRLLVRRSEDEIDMDMEDSSEFRALSEPQKWTIQEDERRLEEAGERRRLQNVLHTTVMYKVYVEKRHESAFTRKEETFADQMKIKLNQAFQDETALAGFSVVQVQFPAPEPKSQVEVTKECPAVTCEAPGTSAMEILGFCFVGICVVVVLAYIGYLVKGRLSRRSRTYVTHIGPPDDIPEKMIAITDNDPAAAFAIQDDTMNQTQDLDVPPADNPD